MKSTKSTGKCVHRASAHLDLLAVSGVQLDDLDIRPFQGFDGGSIVAPLIGDDGNVLILAVLFDEFETESTVCSSDCRRCESRSEMPKTSRLDTHWQRLSTW